MNDLSTQVDRAVERDRADAVDAALDPAPAKDLPSLIERMEMITESEWQHDMADYIVPARKDEWLAIVGGLITYAKQQRFTTANGKAIAQATAAEVLDVMLRAIDEQTAKQFESGVLGQGDGR